MSSIERINQGYEEDALFIPGWATDTRIFNTEKWPVNPYLSPPCYQKTKSDLAEFLKSRPKKIHLIGFSMGSFIASELALLYPNKIKKLHLISSRYQYPQKDIRIALAGIHKNKDQ
ncbi:hypothetical protein DID77_02490, partial [Candidatus Marinamargulisbacteria bacterium SCGC AG-439-L15]